MFSSVFDTGAGFERHLILYLDVQNRDSNSDVTMGFKYGLQEGALFVTKITGKRMNLHLTSMSRLARETASILKVLGD